MVFKLFLEFLFGYVNISVEGYFIERFINICISKNILLWNMKREKSTYINANIGIKEFKKIKQIAKKTKCKVTINRKKGFPFILNRYKKRKIFGIFLILIIVAIFISSNFIWNIEIVGNEKIQQAEIFNLLNENGLCIGNSKRKIDVQKIINNIRMQRDDIAWISINLEGTNVIVKISESSKKPDIIDKEDYCNIVSDKEGVITKISAKTGTALVKPGDIVTKGTVLVGGWMEGKYTGTRYVHSDADIEARVWYTKKEKMNLNQTIEEKTGNKETKYSLSVNNFEINLYKTLPKFEKYDTINENKKLKLFSNFYLPVVFNTYNYYELQARDVLYTHDEAKKILIEKLREELQKEILNKNDIVNENINVNEEEKNVEVEITYEVLETIGTKEKIVF